MRTKNNGGGRTIELSSTSSGNGNNGMVPGSRLGHANDAYLATGGWPTNPAFRRPPPDGLGGGSNHSDPPSFRRNPIHPPSPPSAAAAAAMLLSSSSKSPISSSSSFPSPLSPPTTPSPRIQAPATAAATTTIPSGSYSSRKTPWERFCTFCCFCCFIYGSEPDRKRRRSEVQYRMECILKSNLYKCFVFFFTAFLLFGPQVKNLWLPKESDRAVDALLVTTLFFFVADMLLRVCVNRNYFPFRLPPYYNKNNNNNNNDRNHNDYRHRNRGCVSALWDRACHSYWGSFRAGSFLFWCDFISTISLFYEISWIYPQNVRTQEIHIHLNKYGIPISGLDFNIPYRIEPQFILFLTIAKTAKVLRLVRSTKFSLFTSKINWYWFFHNCSVSGARRNWEALRNMDSQKDNDMNNNNNTTNNNNIGGWQNLSFMSGNTRQTTTTNDIILRAAQQQQQQQQPVSRLSSTKKIPVWHMFKRALESLGILSSQDKEFRRQLAASKIQRAWRAERRRRHTNAPEAAESDANFDVHRSSTERVSNTSLINDRRSEHVASSEKNYNDDGTTGFYNTSVDASRSGRHVSKKKLGRSHVGSAMRELTGQNVSIGIILALLLTTVFTYLESDNTRATTMVILHAQTTTEYLHYDYTIRALEVARSSSVPHLVQYWFADNTTITFPLIEGNDIIEDYDYFILDLDSFRDREMQDISVTDGDQTTKGRFLIREERRVEALIELLSTIFIFFVWLFGVRAFVGPVMILVVMPIERMIRLLGMLTVDPLGYESKSKYSKFMAEEEKLTKNTRWTEEQLKGMETSFLMSTILRIGSLMKVGFGTAGVEIIRNNLAKGTRQNQNILSGEGTTVPCIFLFCDIRQFTDATESLQEEVFKFTNCIAAVVHSYCHAYGGAANKNVGDAFLLSWLLDEKDRTKKKENDFSGRDAREDNFKAKNHQADKALWTVVKINIALQYDEFYLRHLSEPACQRLLGKLADRKGPVVQMGCGLHAGTAVQGAIGSERKIDATYVSEAVEMAEYLESSTKMYGLKVLMSHNFHNLLDTNNRRRCRKVDQILVLEDNDQENDMDVDEVLDQGEVLELYTFDMDLDALNNTSGSENMSDADSHSVVDKTSGSKREVMRVPQRSMSRVGRQSVAGGRRSSKGSTSGSGSDADQTSAVPGTVEIIGGPMGGVAAAAAAAGFDNENNPKKKKHELLLPTGPNMYNNNLWNHTDIKEIRMKYTGTRFPFLQKFNLGLKQFYAKDWKQAERCFAEILEQFEDGLSKYFMKQIQENNGRPPPDFIGYGRM